MLELRIKRHSCATLGHISSETVPSWCKRAKR